MAIKGKKKTRGRGRGVATAPRPVLVAGQKPLLKRTGVRITLIVVLLGLIGLLAGLGIRSRNQTRARESSQESVRQFQTRVEAALSAKAVGQDIGTGFVILPEFGQVLSQLQTGDVKPKDVAAKVKTWTADVTEAADKITALDTGTSEVADDLSDVREQFRSGLTLYIGMARSLGVAATLDGTARDDLISAINEQFQSAASVFDGGWRELQEIRADLDIAEPAPAAPAIPGGGIPGLGEEVPSP